MTGASEARLESGFREGLLAEIKGQSQRAVSLKRRESWGNPDSLGVASGLCGTVLKVAFNYLFRYQGTLTTTIRWLPLSSRRVFRTAARWLWSRY